MQSLEEWGQTEKRVVGINLLRHLARSFTDLLYTKVPTGNCVISHLPLELFHNAALRATTSCTGDKRPSK